MCRRGFHFNFDSAIYSRGKTMSATLLLATVVAAGTIGQAISQHVVDTQNEAFQRQWATDFNWKFDELPTEFTVGESRVPYSGYIYPDTAGGTISALRKYDQAFNGGVMNATAFERRDTSMTAAVTRRITERYGRFGRYSRTRLVTVYATPYWYGHCNGWTSAAIRHAEPRVSVKRNGVTFTPQDIKAMLAEIYIYNDTEMLDGDGTYINAGALHAIVANWLGRGRHPIGMEADPGHEKWNYPIYGYQAKTYRRSETQVDVTLNLSFAFNSDTELSESPRIPRTKYFHYGLELDDNGHIVGGWYYRDSSRIDMLWIPVNPRAGGEPGNERGNPHVDVKEVLAIWRDSVPDELREHWVAVDPAPEDRVTKLEGLAGLLPAPPKPLVPSTADGGDVVAVVGEVPMDAGSDDGN